MASFKIAAFPAAAVALLLSLTMVQAVPVAQNQPGQLLYGPTQFCQGLSPGGGNSCLDIPNGCHIVVPSYNFVPPVVCDPADVE